MTGAPKRNSRRAIATTAQAEFTEYGFAGARVARIARTAGVNKQLVFYYFGSKEQLFRTVVSDAADELLQALSVIPQSGAASSRELRSTFAAVCGTLAERPDLVRLLFRAPQRDATRSLADAVFEACVDRLSGVISRGQGLGYFRDDADPDGVARHAALLAVGYVGVGPVGAAGSPQPDWISSGADLLTHGLAW
jgi:TetR/AcrR family transcriptional regulator